MIRFTTVFTLFLLLTPHLLYANAQDAEAYLDSSDLFSEKKYTEALPAIQKEAEAGSKEAMYRLAYMYQKGLGVEADQKKSAYWYQQSAASYKYVLSAKSTETTKKETISERIKEQMDFSTDQKKDNYVLEKLDLSTPEVKTLVQSVIGGDFFGLRPYQTNYLLPLSIAAEKYQRVSPTVHLNNTTDEQLEYSKHQQNVELEFQLSFQKMLSYDLFGFNESLNLAYTQKVWWQAYSDSAPFRETNYQPEFFLTVPTSESVDEYTNLKALRYGFIHESNGQEGYRSRSWNRIYLTGLWQYKNLFLSTRVWHHLKEKAKYNGYYEGGVDPETGVADPNAPGDDNPDIENYLGYGDIQAKYLYKKNQFGTLLRYNLGSGGKQRGAVELNWSYPFFGSDNVFWYAKFFNGYGESLIDYNQAVTKGSFGFSFSRTAF